MSQIDQVREKIDIVELIGSLGVNLRKTGRSFVGFCPFHPNSRTPAFTVYPDSQSFYCFGCHASGTAFDFVMRKQGLDFKDALELLAARAGVRLEPKNDQERQEDARRARLLEINKAAARYFNYVLLELGRGQPGRDYIAKRALSPEMVEAFQLGYSLDDWGHLFAYLTGKKGFEPGDVEAAGLAIHHESRGHYDRFRGRLIFPIRNARGEVVGFGGRALGDGQPKYLNTPETPLFKKGELLYGLDLARDAIRTEDRTVVAEGYVDVITAHQHGFRNVVAPLGTALTKAHVALLKRLSHNVYLALDADAAGQKATLRGLTALRESAEAGGEGRLVATAQGAVRLESDVALRIIRMPEGRDPDEVIRADPELWRRLVADAAPVMEFYLDAYTAGLDLANPEHQRQALDRLMPLLAELDGAQQRVYIARVEQVVGIRAELILDLLRGRVATRGRAGQGDRPWARNSAEQGRQRPPAARRPTGGIPAGDEPPPPEPPGEELHGPGVAPPRPGQAPRSDESYLLGLAMRYPSVDPAVEALLEAGLAGHPGVRQLFGGGLDSLLEDPVNQELWRRYIAAPLEQRPSEPEAIGAWAELQEEAVAERARLALAQLERRPDDFRYRQEAEQCARRLRIDQALRWIRRLKEQLPGQEDPAELQRLVLLMRDVSLYVEGVKQPRRSSTFPDLRDLTGRE